MVFLMAAFCFHRLAVLTNGQYMLSLDCDSLWILTLEGGSVMFSSHKGLMALIGMVDMQTGTLCFSM
jgi:hypothetical protein